MGRIFGPAVEKAMPVMLKVSFGSIGVLFVTALIYSDKRFWDGWGHAEAMAFMIQRATVILMWLVLVALVVTVIWLAVYMVINSRTENRKPQIELQQTIQPTTESKEPKPLAPIDEEKLKPYFKASFKGMEAEYKSLYGSDQVTRAYTEWIGNGCGKGGIYDI